MEIFKQFITFLFLSISLNAENNSSSLIDKYHDVLCKVLIDSSNKIDNFFIEGNETMLSKTRAEFSTYVAKETYGSLEKDVRFRIKVDLPKIKKHLRLIVEDEESDNLLYDNTRLNGDGLEDKQYHFRFEYFKFLGEKFRAKLGAGARIRSNMLVPYVNHDMNYDFIKEKKIESSLANRFRFYTDGELEDTLEFNSLYYFNEDFYGMFRNAFHYDESSLQTSFSMLSFLKIFSDKKQINWGVGSTNIYENFKHREVDNFQFYGSWHHIFYKDWAYYELAPSILKRELNDYKTSYRFLVSFGIYFNGH
jgi:hypothetical protein